MKFKSLMAILFAISVATTQATEKQSLLSRMFGAVFSSASTVKEKAFCDTHNQIASVTTIGLVSAILGWFGYKKYKKQQQLIPLQRKELHEAVEHVKSKKDTISQKIEDAKKQQEELESKQKELSNQLYKKALKFGILQPRDKNKMLGDDFVQRKLFENEQTAHLYDKFNQAKSKVRKNQATIIKLENNLNSLQKKQEDLLKKEKNFGFFDSLFFRSPFKSSKR